MSYVRFCQITPYITRATGAIYYGLLLRAPLKSVAKEEETVSSKQGFYLNYLCKRGRVDPSGNAVLPLFIYLFLLWLKKDCFTFRISGLLLGLSER